MRISHLLLTLTFLVLRPAFGQDYADCITALEPCDAQTDLVITSNGTGVEDFPCRPKAGCLVDGEHQSTWLRLNVASSGVLKMVIYPSVNADFDFAVYPRNAGCSYLNSATCVGTLPKPVRCSYAQQNSAWPVCADSSVAGGTQGPCNATGMSYNISTNADTSEIYTDTQFSTRAFVRTLPVVAGDRYMVLIDGDAGNTNPFTVSFAGSTAQLMCTVLATAPSYFSYRVQNHDLVWTTYQEGTLCLEELRDSVWVRLSCSKEYTGTFELTPGQQRLILYNPDGRVLAIKVLDETPLPPALHVLDGRMLRFNQPVAYTLTSTLGQQLLSETYTQPRDLGQLTRGVYILQYLGGRHRLFLP